MTSKRETEDRGEMKVSLDEMVGRLTAGPEAERIGMVASHLGVVRAFDLQGRAVMALEVSYDKALVGSIVNETKKLEGIIDVLVEFFEGRLEIGDPILCVAIAGETRRAVFPALTQTVDRIKSEAVKKREVPVPSQQG
jgi:molybdopterin synthase catalytic subunit